MLEHDIEVHPFHWFQRFNHKLRIPSIVFFLLCHIQLEGSILLPPEILGWVFISIYFTIRYSPLRGLHYFLNFLYFFLNYLHLYLGSFHNHLLYDFCFLRCTLFKEAAQETWFFLFFCRSSWLWCFLLLLSTCGWTFVFGLCWFYFLGISKRLLRLWRLSFCLLDF